MIAHIRVLAFAWTGSEPPGPCGLTWTVGNRPWRQFDYKISIWENANDLLIYSTSC